MKRVRIASGLVVGLLVGVAGGMWVVPDVMESVVVTGWTVSKKVLGQAPNCDWGAVTGFHANYREFVDRMADYEEQLRIETYDKDADLVLISLSQRDFWVPSQGGMKDQHFTYILAENDFLTDFAPDKTVKPGDVVIDCGANVGVFVAKALSLGAAKVVAVEPQPRNLECLRRNFRSELAEGRPVLVPQAVWSREGTMNLHFNAGNPGASSLIVPGGSGEIEVQLTTIDLLVAQLGLDRVDFMKFDIEGARETIRRYHPRMMIDRDAVSKTLISTSDLGVDGYSRSSSWCEPSEDSIEPHTVFFWWTQAGSD